MNSKISPQDALFNRRDWIKYGSLLGLAGFVDPNTATAESSIYPTGSSQPATDLQRSPKRYEMMKSINLWAFPYPGKMSLRQCFELAKRAGFDAVEVITTWKVTFRRRLARRTFVKSVRWPRGLALESAACAHFYSGPILSL